MNLQESLAKWRQDVPVFEGLGVSLPDVRAYIPDGWKQNFQLAMDAHPALVTDPNGGIPAFLTTLIDPVVFKILFTPNKAAEIYGEQRKGTWLDTTAMFPVVEYTGEVSSYGDYNDNGRAGLNANWPQRQSYLFQVIKEYGDKELNTAGLARISWVSELDASAALVLNKFLNLTYFFGVAGLQNYGFLNDPNLGASLTPATKSAGGVRWISTAGVVVATANEIFTDIQSIYSQLIIQTGGLIEATDKLVLAMSPATAVALTQTNTFNVNVHDLLKKNFPNMRIETAVQYGATSATNTQGLAGGNLIQLFVESIEGQPIGYSAFNEKMRSFPIIRAMSSYRQKVMAGTWGAVLRMPICIASMLGV